MSCTFILLALMSPCQIKQTSKGTLSIKQDIAVTDRQLLHLIAQPANLDTTWTDFRCLWEFKLCSGFWTFIKVNSEISKMPPP